MRLKKIRTFQATVIVALLGETIDEVIEGEFRATFRPLKKSETDLQMKAVRKLMSLSDRLIEDKSPELFAEFEEVQEQIKGDLEKILVAVSGLEIEDEKGKLMTDKQALSFVKDDLELAKFTMQAYTEALTKKPDGKLLA